jgi:hypothetical protein
MVFNRTRKRNRNKNKNTSKKITNYSEGFIRRMTDDIGFVSFTPTGNELERLRKIRDDNKKKIDPENDKLIEEYINNYPKKRAEYLESLNKIN